MKGFREFVLRGNVVDLAVAVVIGAAFGAVVSALVKDLITPLIAAIVGQPDFSGLTFTLNNSRFLYGEFINAVVAFILVAAAIYYLIVLPMTKIARRQPAKAATQKCPECLSDIPIGARRCCFCTAQLASTS